jgi:hypothetical protein
MKKIFNSKLQDTLLELIGCIELFIGLFTLLFVILFDIFSIIEKPQGVFIFVLLSASISAFIGYGILTLKKWARIFIIFFSGYVIILKILLYLGVVKFTGEIIKTPPSHIKDLISLLYHIFVIIFFTNSGVISRFEESSKNPQGGKRWTRKKS